MSNQLKYILFVFLFFIQNLFGQNPYYHTVNKTNGLPSNTVYDIYQDKNEMIWLATNDGICSYDGFQFKSYYNDDQTSKAGSNIVEDSFGRIWYCNFDGNIYYVEKGKLHILDVKKPIGYHKFNIIGNQLIYLEKNELVFLDLKTLKKTNVLPFDTNVILGVQKKGNSLFVFSNYLFEIRSASDIKKYQIPSEVKVKFNGGLFSVSNENLLIVSKYSNDYCLFNDGKFELKKFESPFNFIQNVSVDNQYNWFSTTKGLLKINLNIPNSKPEKYFEQYNISTIYKDKNQGCWITTLNEGVLYIPHFKNILYPTIAIPIVIEQIENEIYYGTANDKLVKTNDLKNLQNHQVIFNGNSNHSVVNLNYNSFNNELIFTSNTFKIKNIKGSVFKENVIAIKQVLVIDDSFYAYAASGNCGLIKMKDGKSNWNAAHEKFRKLSNLSMDYSSMISGVRGKSVAYDRLNETLFFATNLGLFQFKKEQSTEIKPNHKSLNLSKIYFHNQLILGLTTNNNLVEINVNNHQMKTIYDSKIKGNLLLKIRQIDDLLYLITSNSIITYHLTTRKMQKIFNVNSDVEINDILAKDDHLYLATSKGIISLDSTTFSTEKQPKFLLQNVLVNQKSISLEKLNELDYDENDIEIQFSVISYLQSPNTPIYYSINNGNWQEIKNNNRSLLLNSLASGNYTIAFKTSLNNVSPTEVSFKINQPIWAKWWFILLLILAGLYGISLFYRNRIRKIQLRNQIVLEKVALENSLNQSKIKAIKSQMNPHFFYNALNTLQSYILSNDKKQALNYLSKFSNLTRTILELTEKDTISIAEEIKTLSLYLEIEKARFDDDFDYQIIVAPEIDSEQTKIPSMLLQPYVENAIKHGLLHKEGLKKMSIQFFETENYISISIDDNGIGRKKSSELNSIKNKNHQSFATKAIQNRIDLLNQNQINKISIEFTDKVNPSQMAIGTTVRIEIPKNENL